MDWLSILTESVVSAAIEIIALASLALIVWYRQRRALKQGKLENVVLLSFNQIVEHEGEPRLAFRTPLVGSIGEIFFSDGLVKEIKRAAHKTTDSDPIVRLSDPKLHGMMKRGLINFSNQLNTAGQVAALTGQPFTEEPYYLALTYEPGAVTKMFRILLVNERLFKRLDEIGDDLTFDLPYHRERLSALKAIRAEMAADDQRPPIEHKLALFMVAAPVADAQAIQELGTSGSAHADSDSEEA
jgi:hypothetical protein